MKKSPKKLFEPSGFNSHFPADVKTFAEYTDRMRAIITQTRIDLDTTNTAIEANSPCEYIPDPQAANSRYGILLIHGLFYSPYIMQSLFDHFRQKNFFARSLLLPGHGTVPGDLLEVDYYEWIKATTFAIDSFKQHVDKLFVVGFSTGASLALYQALAGMAIDALILFAPALALANPFAWISNPLCLFGKIFPFAQWFNVYTESDYSRYFSIPYNAIAQVYRLGKCVLHQAKKTPLTIPQFIITTTDDEVISTSTTINFFQRYQHPQNRLILYTNQQKTYADQRIQQRPSSYPEKRIINFSHNCLPVSPTHPHYGDNNGIPDLHCYESFWGNLFRKDEKKPLYMGAITLHDLLRYRLSRLTYNPDFNYLIHAIDEFITACLK